MYESAKRKKKTCKATRGMTGNISNKTRESACLPLDNSAVFLKPPLAMPLARGVPTHENGVGELAPKKPLGEVFALEEPHQRRARLGNTPVLHL